MNPGGIALVILGVWVGCQVLAGDALERLNVLPTGGSSAPAPAKPAAATSTGSVVNV